MTHLPDENASPNLAALGDSFDHATAWALMRVLELVRQDVDGLAGIVFMRCGDEKILSADFEHCALKAQEFHRQYVSGKGEAVAAYLIAYEGRWWPEHIGELHSVFLECQSRWMPEPIRGRVDLVRDKSGMWFLDETMHVFQPSTWSVQGFRTPVNEDAESQKLANEHALVRQEIEKIKVEQKKFRRVSNRATEHPKFGRWHLQIQRIGEGITSLKKKIEFVEDQIRHGETPSAYDYQFPDHQVRPPREPEQKPEEIIAPDKTKLCELAGRILPICWRHMWQSGNLAMRIKAMAKVNADLLKYQHLPDRIQAASSARELKQIEQDLKSIQAADDTRHTTFEHRKLAQDKATLLYMKQNLERSKEYAEMLAAEPLDDEGYVARTVVELESRIVSLKREEAKLNERLKELEKTKVDDPPMAWHNALGNWEWDCREETPIPEPKDFTPEERARKRVIEKDIREWWESCYPEIIAKRSQEIERFATAEPWVVIFTSDLAGLWAAEDAFVPKFPRGHRYLLCEEYEPWIREHPDNDFIWHIRVSTVFVDLSDPNELDEARAMFSDVPPGQFRIQRTIEKWCGDSCTQTIRLWRWDGRELSLLAHGFGGSA